MAPGSHIEIGEKEKEPCTTSTSYPCAVLLHYTAETLSISFLFSLLVTYSLRTPCGSCFRRQSLCVAEAVVRTLSSFFLCILSSFSSHLPLGHTLVDAGHHLCDLI